jgi:hypothetical protein
MLARQAGELLVGIRREDCCRGRRRAEQRLFVDLRLGCSSNGVRVLVELGLIELALRPQARRARALGCGWLVLFV